jgi:hypothetical protein
MEATTQLVDEIHRLEHQLALVREGLEKIAREHGQCYGQEYRECWKIAQQTLAKLAQAKPS